MSERFEFTRVNRLVDGEAVASGLPAILDLSNDTVAPFPAGKDKEVREFLGYDDRVIASRFIFATPGEEIVLGRVTIVYELAN